MISSEKSYAQVYNVHQVWSVFITARNKGDAAKAGRLMKRRDLMIACQGAKDNAVRPSE